MYIDRSGGVINAAYMREQHQGQEWLPTDNAELVAFLSSFTV